MFNLQKNKGFTLIELLVVIAIIGILASMILVALNTARTKAKDARVKNGMTQFRTAAQFYYEANGNNYGVGFGTDAAPLDNNIRNVARNTESPAMADDFNLSKLYTDINKYDNTGSTPVFNFSLASGKWSKYAMRTQLSDSTWWCVDSSQNAKVATSATGGVCTP